MQCLDHLKPSLLAALLALVALPAVPAQIVAYPQDSVGATAFSLLPLGAERADDRYHEARYQQLIPATHLPTAPSNITAMAMPIGGIGTADVDYARLDITLSPSPSTVLSPTFANNLPAPQVVWSSRGLRSYTVGQWNVIPFDRPFAHDGISAVVIEFRKVVRSTAAIFFVGSSTADSLVVGPPGPRLGQATWGPTGSGAADSLVATATHARMRVRLLVDTPTITLRSDPDFFNVSFRIGAAVELRVYGPAGAPYCTTNPRNPRTSARIQAALIKALTRAACAARTAVKTSRPASVTR